MGGVKVLGDAIIFNSYFPKAYKRCHHSKHFMSNNFYLFTKVDDVKAINSVLVFFSIHQFKKGGRS